MKRTFEIVAREYNHTLQKLEVLRKELQDMLDATTAAPPTVKILVRSPKKKTDRRRSKFSAKRRKAISDAVKARWARKRAEKLVEISTAESPTIAASAESKEGQS